MNNFPFIKTFLETSFIDWDGKIVAVLFTGGCNLRCPFCQNVPLVEHPEKMKTVDFEKIFNFLKAKKSWLDGACVTGGEPLIHKDLPEFFKIIKSIGLKIKLDTNGCLPEIMGNLIREKLIDYVAMDLKGPLDERYARITGINGTAEAVSLTDNIRQSLGILKKSGLDYELRTTFVPGLVGPEELQDMLAEIKGVPKYAVQNFKPKQTLDPAFHKTKPFSAEELNQLAELAKPFAAKVVIRN